MSLSRSRNVSNARWLLAGAGACVASLGFFACSSPFSDCQSARNCSESAGTAGLAGEAGEPGGGTNTGGSSTGGSGGEASGAIAAAGESSGGDGSAGAPVGEAGAAGAGGAEPAPECVHDADCSDHLACTGVETCQAGVCVPGVSPCANPDVAHCDVVCKELNGAASCTVQGQDKDKDTHLSAACAANRGDDCNDADATTHPGATELCDGVDHNCNLKIGLNDGLPVSGTTVALGPANATRGTPAIAWATDKSVYGIVYYDGTTSTTADLYFETVDKTGTGTPSPKAFNDTLKSLGSGVSLTWGGDRFGASWVVNGANVYFRTIDSIATLGNPLSTYSGSFLSNAGIARIPSGNWAVLYWSTNPGVGTTLYGNTVSATGVVSSTPSQLGGAVATSSTVAPNGSNFVVGQAFGGNLASAAVWNAALTTKATVLINGTVPVVGSGPNGYAIAATSTAPANPPQLYMYGPTGTALCGGPVNIADKNFVPAAIVGTSKGYLVVSSGQVRAQEVLANCTLGALFTVDLGLSATNVGIAGSAAGYGVVWQDKNSIPQRHMFGPLFCN